jgi:hypothetical protein
MTSTHSVTATADIAQATAATNEICIAERCLYDAEVALHIAHQTQVDAWITAAAERLHDAILAHTEALHATHIH